MWRGRLRLGWKAPQVLVNCRIRVRTWGSPRSTNLRVIRLTNTLQDCRAAPRNNRLDHQLLVQKDRDHCIEPACAQYIARYTWGQSLLTASGHSRSSHQLCLPRPPWQEEAGPQADQFDICSLSPPLPQYCRRARRTSALPQVGQWDIKLRLIKYLRTPKIRVRTRVILTSVRYGPCV